MISTPQRTAIRQLARNVFATCELSTPIDVVAAVTKLQGTISDPNGSRYTAKIINLGNQSFCVRLGGEANQDGSRFRFTIATELGHLFLHMGYVIDLGKWAGFNEYTDYPSSRSRFAKEDKEAREFARALTMPEEEYRAAFSEVQEMELRHAIQRLAERFGVPEREAGIHGKTLGLIPWEYD